MGLRAVEPETIETHLKLLVFGEAGSGKTWAFCQFPKAYYCDLEQGAEKDEYKRLLKEAGSVIFSTIDLDEVIRETTALLSEKHNYKTLIIDPITAVFKDETDFAENRVGSDYGKNVAEADKKWRKLGKLIKRLKMNVLVSAYAKREFTTDKNAIARLVPSGPKDLDHFFDVVLQTEKRGKERVARVIKSRLKEIPDGETIPFSFQSLAERIGPEMLNREAVPVELASPEQVAEITRLLSQHVEGEKLKAKALKKANADELSELPADIAAKFLNSLRSAEVAA